MSRFEAGGSLTALAEWFVDDEDDLLAVVVDVHESVDAVDAVVAYALAWQHDRDLALVLPESHARATLARLPWIETPVRVFTYGTDHEVRPAVVPARAEVLAAASARLPRRTEVHHLGDRADWVDGLVHGADDHWALVPAHRASYLAWHCAGRQVLRVSRSGGGVRIEAGVAYRRPPPGEEAPLASVVTAPLTPMERAQIESRIAAAIYKRVAGHDRGHVEHRMQAALAATQLRDLGLSSFAREYPAWRDDGRGGFVDFLGLDRRGRLHVVETKVGTTDPTAVLQGLDYAIWVAANGAAIRRERGWPEAPGDETVVLDLVLAPKKAGSQVIGPYLAPQLECLTGDVSWRVAVVTDPHSDTPEVSGPWYRTFPPPGPQVSEPVQRARWAGRIGAGLRAGGEGDR